MADEWIGPRIAAVYELQSSWLEPKLERHGIGWGTFQLLTAVAGAGNKASQAEIARRLGVTPATLSESVFSHVKKGLIEQVSNGRDRRIKTLKTTEEAKKLLRRIHALIGEAESVLVKGLSEDEATTLKRLLDKVIDSLV